MELPIEENQRDSLPNESLAVYLTIDRGDGVRQRVLVPKDTYDGLDPLVPGLNMYYPPFKAEVLELPDYLAACTYILKADVRDVTANADKDYICASLYVPARVFVLFPR